MDMARQLFHMFKIKKILSVVLMSTFVSIAEFTRAAEPATQAAGAAKLLEVRRVWDSAPHNAFTDLIRFQDAWYLTFREGSGHVSPDGVVRVLRSTDGNDWETVARFASDNQDLRECKFAITPNGFLALTGAAHNLGRPGEPNHYSYTWFSKDGREWSERMRVVEPNVWLWRTVWHDGVGYGLGYSTVEPFFLRLYTTPDAKNWNIIVPQLFVESMPNEAGAVFLKNDTMLILLRRDRDPFTAQLGMAEPPYTHWVWKDLGQRIGSPLLMQLPDGRLLAPVRLLNPMRMSLCWVNPDAGKLTEFLTLPSGGDSGYPGAVLHDGVLWVSYYSSHENKKSSIYIAKVVVN